MFLDEVKDPLKQLLKELQKQEEKQQQEFDSICMKDAKNQQDQK